MKPITTTALVMTMYAPNRITIPNHNLGNLPILYPDTLLRERLEPSRSNYLLARHLPLHLLPFLPKLLPKLPVLSFLLFLLVRWGCPYHWLRNPDIP